MTATVSSYSDSSPFDAIALDITDDAIRRMPHILSADSVAAVRGKIDVAMSQLNAFSPIRGGTTGSVQNRMIGAFLRHNIVKHQGLVYAIHRSLGPIDLNRQMLGAPVPGLKVAASVLAVIAAIVTEKLKALYGHFMGRRP